LRRVAFDLALQKVDVAPEDVSFSSLVFRDSGSDLRLTYEDGDLLSELKPSGEFPRAEPSSFVWVGPHEQSKHRADIDLSRATLTVARDYDLMKLRFQFLDFVLAFTPTPVIRPARADCRLIRTDDGKYIDSRPVLVAEFDPQHVLEEALFRPEPPDLPDVEIKDGDHQITREEILGRLDDLKDDSTGLLNYRQGIRQKKIDQEKLNPPVFRPFAAKYEEQAASAGLPDDQRVYLGPYGLDADAMHLARSVFKNDLQATVEAVVRQTFERVKGEVIPSLKAADRFMDSVGDKSSPSASFENALRNERAFEEIEPVYAAFRSFYREERFKAEQANPPPNSQPPEVMNRLLWRTEFLSEGNRPKVPIDTPPSIRRPSTGKLGSRTSSSDSWTGCWGLTRSRISWQVASRDLADWPSASTARPRRTRRAWKPVCTKAPVRSPRRRVAAASLTSRFHSRSRR
jgi:hypothetical protein